MKCSICGSEDVCFCDKAIDNARVSRQIVACPQDTIDKLATHKVNANRVPFIEVPKKVLEVWRRLDRYFVSLWHSEAM